MGRVVAVVVAVVLLVGATIGLHYATAPSSDAWAASIEAMATVVLVGVTVWYVYLTYRLISVQDGAPRRQSWEASLRELGRLMARRHQELWTAANFFLIDTAARPPMITDITDSRDALKDVRNEVLELVGLLPKDTAGSALGVAAYIVNAETELHAPGGCSTRRNARRPGKQRSWAWSGARAAHLASDDPERNEAWDDILRGRHALAAQKRWEELSLSLDNELTA